MNIQKTKSMPEILRTMYMCAEVFPNPDLKDDKLINTLAQKYAEIAEFYVVYSGTETVGFIAYYCHDESENAFVSMLMVREKFQRQGIGRAFLECVINDCKNLGKNRIRLEVDTDNAKGLSFYKKNGFVRECPASEHSDYYALELQA